MNLINSALVFAIVFESKSQIEFSYLFHTKQNDQNTKKADLKIKNDQFKMNPVN